jgi:hypothetical protein
MLALVIDPVLVPVLVPILALERLQSLVAEKIDEQTKVWILKVFRRPTLRSRGVVRNGIEGVACEGNRSIDRNGSVLPVRAMGPEGSGSPLTN